MTSPVAQRQMSTSGSRGEESVNPEQPQPLLDSRLKARNSDRVLAQDKRRNEPVDVVGGWRARVSEYATPIVPSLGRDTHDRVSRTRITECSSTIGFGSVKHARPRLYRRQTTVAEPRFRASRSSTVAAEAEARAVMGVPTASLTRYTVGQSIDHAGSERYARPVNEITGEGA